MKTFRLAFEETRSARDKSTGLVIAGMIAMSWGTLMLPEYQLLCMIGIVLVLAACAHGAAVFFSSLFMLGWWERGMSERRYAEWKAGASARVDAAIAAYNAEQAQRIADRSSN